MTESLIKVFFLLLFSAIGVIWGGYVLQILWAWFFVTMFGLPQLSIPAACGVALTVRFMTYTYGQTKDQKTSEAIVLMMLVPLLVLAYGWVIKQFI